MFLKPRLVTSNFGNPLAAPIEFPSSVGQNHQKAVIKIGTYDEKRCAKRTAFLASYARFFRLFPNLTVFCYWHISDSLQRVFWQIPESDVMAPTLRKSSHFPPLSHQLCVIVSSRLRWIHHLREPFSSTSRCYICAEWKAYQHQQR